MYSELVRPLLSVQKNVYSTVQTALALLTATTLMVVDTERLPSCVSKHVALKSDGSGGEPSGLGLDTPLHHI